MQQTVSCFALSLQIDAEDTLPSTVLRVESQQCAKQEERVRHPPRGQHAAAGHRTESLQGDAEGLRP